MTDLWEERKKGLENEYVYRQEKEKIARMKEQAREAMVKECCRNLCPKCVVPIEPLIFRGVPLDKCPSCGGVWLGPKDLQVLAEKDHRSWFDKWFKEEE